MQDMNPEYRTVGMELGGALMAMVWDGRIGVIRKDGTIYPTGLPHAQVCLVDDVGTTESSLNMATEKLARFEIEVAQRICVLDSRLPEFQTLEIKSLVTTKDSGLENLP